MRLTPRGAKQTATLRVEVPAGVWAAAKRQAAPRLETRLAAIVTQALRLVANTGEGR